MAGFSRNDLPRRSSQIRFLCEIQIGIDDRRPLSCLLWYLSLSVEHLSMDQFPRGSVEPSVCGRRAEKWSGWRRGAHSESQPATAPLQSSRRKAAALAARARLSLVTSARIAKRNGCGREGGKGRSSNPWSAANRALVTAEAGSLAGLRGLAVCVACQQVRVAEHFFSEVLHAQVLGVRRSDFLLPSTHSGNLGRGRSASWKLHAF